MKVVSRKNLPAKLPIYSTAVAYLLLDKFHAADWVWGVIGTLYTLIWIICIVAIVKQEQVELFPKESESAQKAKPKTFQERIDELRSR